MKKSKIFLASLSLLLLGSSLGATSKVSAAGENLVLERDEGYTLKFKVISGVSTYSVIDDNDYRSSITLNASDAVDGYLSYTTEVVGKHNVYVKTASGIKSNTVSVENQIVHYAGTFNTWFHMTKAQILAGGQISSDVYQNLPNWSSAADNTDYVFYLKSDSTLSTDGNDQVWYPSSGETFRKELNLVKESGANVVQIEAQGMTTPGMANDVNTWKYTQKWFLDECWKVGIKCVFHDSLIISKCDAAKSDASVRDDTDAEVATTFAHLASDNFKSLMEHPGFLGFTVGDEPNPQDIPYFAKVTKYINGLYNTYGLKNKITITYLFPYNRWDTGNFAGGKSVFKNYIESWVTATGLDYFFIDMYTYTANGYYGNKSDSWDSTKVTYEVVNEVIAAHPGLRFLQMCTSNRARTSSTSYSSQDIYASMAIAAAQKNFGISWFTFKDFYNDGNWDCGLVNYKTEKRDVFTWVKDANKQFVRINQLLDKYTLNTYSYTDPGAKSTALRYANFSYKNGDDNAYMYVNYNTYTGTTTTYDVTVSSDYCYYTFGVDAVLTPVNGTGAKVAIKNGQGILVLPKVSVTDQLEGATANGSTGEVSYDSTSGKMFYDLKSSYGAYAECTLPKYDFSKVTQASTTIYVSSAKKTYVPMLTTSDRADVWNTPMSCSMFALNIENKGTNNLLVTMIGSDETISTKTVTDSSVYVGAKGLSFLGRQADAGTGYYVDFIKGNGTSFTSNVGLSAMNGTVTINGEETSVKTNDSYGGWYDLVLPVANYGMYDEVTYTLTNVGGCYVPKLQSSDAESAIGNGTVSTLVITNKGKNNLEAKVKYSDTVTYTRTITNPKIYQGKIGITLLLREAEPNSYYKVKVNLPSKVSLNSYMSLGFRFDHDEKSIFNDEVRIQFGADKRLIDFAGDREYGIKVSTGSKSAYYTGTQLHIDDKCVYSLISLGNVFSAGRFDVEFTVQGYVVDGSNKIYTNPKTYSVKGMIVEYYTNGDAETKKALEWIYNYLTSEIQPGYNKDYFQGDADYTWVW